MKYQNLTLLIMAAECSELIWTPIPFISKTSQSADPLVMDYAVKFAVAAGCMNVVITVCSDKKRIAFKHMKAIGEKYAVPISVVTVRKNRNSAVDQITAAEDEFSDNGVIVMNADVYFATDIYDATAKNLLEAHRPCMTGHIPQHSLSTIEKSVQSELIMNHICWDWRIRKNMFGLTLHAIHCIKMADAELRAYAKQYPKQQIYGSLNLGSLELCLSRVMQTYSDFPNIFDNIEMRRSYRFTLANEIDWTQIYYYDGKLHYSNTSVVSCDHFRLYFYRTPHHTLAVNFDAYANYKLCGPTCSHFHLEKPLETYIPIQDLEEADSSIIIEKQFNWESSFKDDWCKEDCTASLLFRYENKKVYLEYIGKWIEHSRWEKYADSLDVYAHAQQPLEFLRDLNDGDTSDDPMMCISPRGI